MTPFDEALAIAQRWPGDTTAPGELRQLFDRVTGRDGFYVAQFVEALYAAAETPEHLDLITKAWGDVSIEADDDAES